MAGEPENGSLAVTETNLNVVIGPQRTSAGAGGLHRDEQSCVRGCGELANHRISE